MNKHYYKKYLKYKKKYLELKGGTTTQPSDKIMPDLSFSPKEGHIFNLKNKILVALNNGCKHIDIKSRYSHKLDASIKDYLIQVKEGIEQSRTSRKELWITWNSGKIISDEENIEQVIKILNCDYIDTVIGNNGDLAKLVLLRDQGLIKNLAVENIYDFEKIKELQGLYGINTLQIQPNIKYHELIKKCNEIGIKVQLYAISSSIKKYSIDEYESGNFDILEKPEIIYVINNILRYYMEKYIKTGNVIIIESKDIPDIVEDITLYNKIINGEKLTNIERIESLLTDVGDNLPVMESGNIY